MCSSAGARALEAAHGEPPKPRGLRLHKWRRAAWKLAGKSLLLAMGAHVTHGAWAADASAFFWGGWPAHAHSRGMRVFYAAEMAFYLYGLLHLLAQAARGAAGAAGRGAMLLHHAASFSLLLISFHYKCARPRARLHALVPF